MPKDNVLRTLVNGTLDGKLAPRIVDTIANGDHYTLVLEWAFLPGVEGEYPKRAIILPKAYFQVETGTDFGFELKLLRAINFDALVWKDVPITEEEVWGHPENLSYPRPNEDGPLP